jgi:hypothetical protein
VYSASRDTAALERDIVKQLTSPKTKASMSCAAGSTKVSTLGGKKYGGRRTLAATPHVVIEGIQRHVPFTFYRSGDAMWAVMTPRAPGRASEGIPAYQCVKTGSESGLYDWVVNDMEACRREGVARQIEELET